jgi:hypothetical protein
MTFKLNPDHLRSINPRDEYYEDVWCGMLNCAKSWEEDLNALEEANEQIEELTKKIETLEKKRLKNGDLTIRTARKASKYPCRNCGNPIKIGDEYIQRSEYAPHQERWNYTHWHTRCPRSFA